MDNMQELLGRICSLEEMIEGTYLNIVDAEIEGNDLNYNYYCKNLLNLLKLEEQLIEYAVKSEFILALKQKISQVKTLEPHHFALGHITNSYFWRLIDITDRFGQDEGLEYVSYLVYDVNKITLRILEELIHNPAYQDIQEDLIRYKYNIFYLNRDNETDFIYGEGNKNVELKSKEYRNLHLPSYSYLDLGVLVFFSQQDIDVVYGSSIENNHDKMKVISYVIDFLARLTLCSEENLDFVFSDVLALMNSETVDEEVKELFLDLLQIYEKVKDNLVWSK